MKATAAIILAGLALLVGLPLASAAYPAWRPVMGGLATVALAAIALQTYTSDPS